MAEAGAYLSFEEARAYVHKLMLKSSAEWGTWSISGGRPANIPSTPFLIYRDQGWVSMPDFLGSESHSNQSTRVGFLPFEMARDLMRTLKLKSYTEWRAWCKGGHRPVNIPSDPD